MVGDKNTDITVFQSPYDMLNILYSYRVYTSKRFIKHDELWVDGKASCNLCTSTLTSGKLITFVLTHFLQAKLVEQTFQTFQALLFVEFRHLKHGHNVIFYAHLAEHTCLLWQISNTSTSTLIYRIVGYLLIIDEYMSLVGHNESGGHIEGCGFAGSIRSK